MGYILGVLDYIAYIAADVDFYNIEGNSGDSYLPFVGFMLFLIGFVVIFMGFNLFYDQRDSVNIDKAANQKNKNAGIIMMAVGLMFLIISFFVI